MESVAMVACENTLPHSVPMVENRNVFQDIFPSSDMIIHSTQSVPLIACENTLPLTLTEKDVLFFKLIT